MLKTPKIRILRSRPDRFVEIQNKSKALETHVLRAFSLLPLTKTFNK